MSEPTADEIARGRELLAAATPGVWGKVASSDTPEIGSYVMGTAVGYSVIRHTDREYGDPVMDDEDADLIVWMHDALPGLLDAAEECGRLLALVAAQAEQIAGLQNEIERRVVGVCIMSANFDANRCLHRERAEAMIARVRALCDRIESEAGQRMFTDGVLSLAGAFRAALDGTEGDA